MNSKDISILPSISLVPEAFSRYIEQGQVLAKNADLRWNIKLNQNGVAIAGQSWDLRKLLKDGNPKPSKLRTFSIIQKVIKIMGMQGLIVIEDETLLYQVSNHWQDMIKAYTLNHLLVAGLSLGHLSSICGVLRFLATVTGNKEPWRLDADDILRSMEIAKIYQPSGQLTIVISSFVKNTFDAYHLLESCPVFPLISSERILIPAGYRTSKFAKKANSLSNHLSQRKSEEKLPDKRAFWELMRIVFTEKPKTFLDAMRFAQGKIMVITGLRIGEVSFLPVDWKRTVGHLDRNGVPAGVLISVQKCTRSLRDLRVEVHHPRSC